VDRWFVDDTYVKVAGAWRYVYRAVDQFGQVIDVYVSGRRDLAAAQRFFGTAIGDHGRPTEVVADRAPSLLRAIDELLPDACHDTTPYVNNRIEADHGRLKARLRPLRGVKTDRSASIVIQGHGFVQNVRRGHYELGAEARHSIPRLAAAFDELASAI
jgi:transposase-like protein